METKLKNTLEELKLKILENLETIRLNDKVISLMMVTPQTTEKLNKLKEKFEENKELLNENVTILDAQFKIVSMISKFKSSDDTQSVSNIQKNINELFNETITGKLNFDKKHPFYKDQEFINQLISHYSSNEQFEECNKLLDLKNDIDNVY